jgi:hypothetical protein
MLEAFGGRTTAPPGCGLHSGVSIVNARGVPGTLGCLAHTLHDRRRVFVTSHHVLFGGGASEGERVWSVGGTDQRRCFRYAGRSSYGKLGTVRHGGGNVHVDCAVAELDSQIAPSSSCVAVHTASDAPLAPGDHVSKTGAASGTTHGVVVDVGYFERVFAEGRWHEAPSQIRVRSLTPSRAFSSEGDSGAVLRNVHGAVVGLLWGANTRGDGVACPIAPVLYVLNIRLEHCLSWSDNRISPAFEVP